MKVRNFYDLLAERLKSEKLQKYLIYVEVLRRFHLMKASFFHPIEILKTFVSRFL